MPAATLWIASFVRKGLHHVRVQRVHVQHVRVQREHVQHVHV